MSTGGGPPRLIGEIRVGTNPYDLAYTYDTAGNRLTKLDGQHDLLVEYEYDYADPATYGGPVDYFDDPPSPCGRGSCRVRGRASMLRCPGMDRWELSV